LCRHQEMMNTYNNLVEKCFNECVTSFRTKAGNSRMLPVITGNRPWSDCHIGWEFQCFVQRCPDVCEKILVGGSGKFRRTVCHAMCERLSDIPMIFLNFGTLMKGFLAFHLNEHLRYRSSCHSASRGLGAAQEVGNPPVARR